MTDHEMTLLTLGSIARRLDKIASELPPLLAAQHVANLHDVRESVLELRQLLKGEANASATPR